MQNVSIICNNGINECVATPAYAASFLFLPRTNSLLPVFFPPVLPPPVPLVEVGPFKPS